MLHYLEVLILRGRRVKKLGLQALVVNALPALGGAVDKDLDLLHLSVIDNVLHIGPSLLKAIHSRRHFMLVAQVRIHFPVIFGREIINTTSSCS